MEEFKEEAARAKEPQQGGRKDHEAPGPETPSHAT